MLVLAGSLYYDAIAIFVTILAGLVVYYKWSFSYWKRRGIPYLEPSIPFGNTLELFKAKYNFGEQFEVFYNAIKRHGWKHGGVYMFARPFYVPTEPQIIKDIMVKNFSHFVDRGFYINEEVDPLTGHLFSLEGDKWKNLRSKLSATFTSGKMKMMFQTMADCAKELQVLVDHASVSSNDLDIKETLARFTTDVISSCAFGLESNSLKDPNTDFRHFGRRFVENTTLENLRNLIQFTFPRKVLSLVNFKTIKPDLEKFMMTVVKKIVDYREKNNISRKDFLHLLLQLKNRGKISDDDSILDDSNKNKEVALTLNELTAQVFVFFVGGFETSSTTMTWTLYELSKNKVLQEKLRKEINTVLARHKNELSYEAIMEMTFMDQVINETLRLYPALAFLNRQCTIPYKIPDTEITLEKGTMVVIPILGLQKDPEYYPNPEKYDPERFNEENKNSRPGFTWLPFGEGPRICIGMRFGLLQTKIGLATVLSKYEVNLSRKTQQPIVTDKKSFVTTSQSAIYLNVSKIVSATS